MDETLKTQEECWEDFWNIVGPALVDLHQRGLLPANPEEPTVE